MKRKLKITTISISSKIENFRSLKILKIASNIKIPKENKIKFSDKVNRLFDKEYPETSIWWITFRIIKYPMKSSKYFSKTFILGIDSIRKFT